MMKGTVYDKTTNKLPIGIRKPPNKEIPMHSST